MEARIKKKNSLQVGLKVHLCIWAGTDTMISDGLALGDGLLNVFCEEAVSSEVCRPINKVYGGIHFTESFMEMCK